MKKILYLIILISSFGANAQKRTYAPAYQSDVTILQSLISDRLANGGNAVPVAVGTTGADDLTLKTNNTTRFTIDGSTGYMRRGTGTADFGFHLFGTGVGSVIALGDRFDATTPYAASRERGGTDTDQWEVYGQKGSGLFSGAYGGTARVWVNLSGDVMVGTETPVAGAEFTVNGDQDLSGNLNVQGNGTFGSFVKLKNSSTPPTPANGTEGNAYIKANKFILQYNDGGTVRYKYMDLNGTGTTFTHTTTAP